MCIVDQVKCDLGEGVWDTPCMKCDCCWHINKKDASNCFILYKNLIKDHTHTLYQISRIIGISHTAVKQIEEEALQKLKNTPQLEELS